MRARTFPEIEKLDCFPDVASGMFPRDYGYGQMGSRTFKGLDNGGFGHLGIVRY